MVKHLPHISIEKYAAYLDGNLPDEEMQQMKAFIDNDSEMQAVLEADGNIGDDFDLDLIDNEPVPFDMELPSIELPTLDLYSPIEQSGFIDEIFSPAGDRFGDEMGSILDDGANHHGFLDETDDMNSNFGIEDDPLDLAASEDLIGLAPDTPYDWTIHDGDYGFLELGLPPIINESDLIDAGGMTTNSFEMEDTGNWTDSFDSYN